MHGLEEQRIHFLERDTLGLGHEEETPYTHGDKDGGEEEVRTIPEIADHVGCAARNDEGSKPGIRGSKGDAQHSDIEREYLGRVCPRHSLPRRTDDERVDVHAHHGEVTPAVAIDGAGCCGGGGVGLHDVPADVPHGYAAKGGAPDETFAATDAFDDDEGECAHAERLRDAVEAGGEEPEGSAGDTEGFEDTGSVICNDVDLSLVSDDEVSVRVTLTYSCEALQEHESKTDGHTISNTLLEEFLELRLLAHTVGTTLLYLCANFAHLMLDICVR